MEDSKLSRYLSHVAIIAGTLTLALWALKVPFGLMPALVVGIEAFVFAALTADVGY